MESLLHILDYDHYKIAKKVIAQKEQDDGFEAPRNSLEVQMETLHNLHSGGDSLMDALNSPNIWTEQTCYSTEASIEKLISEERQNSKQNSPSVIARLMGVDVFPSEKKAITKPVGKANDMHELLKESYLKNGIDGHNPSHRRFSKLRRFNSFDSADRCNPDTWIDDTRLDKPRPREHPQEEELQKFKREFEAYQTARIKECSNFMELGHTHTSQWLAQEKLNREKINFYAKSVEMKEDPKPAAHKGNTYFMSEQKDSYMKNSGGNVYDPASEPSKIVILRPGPDAIGINSEDSWVSSPCFSDEKGSIEEFLEEVKERLRCDLQGKPCKRSSVVRGGGIETPYSEKPSDPKQIAQRIAKQVRESVTKDLGAMNLYRSESTRSYRSEMQFNGAGSPEFISRDTRKLLAERLRNVLKEESHRNVPVLTRGGSRLSIMNSERQREEQLRHGLNARYKSRNWHATNNMSDMQCRSFRGDPNANGRIHEDSSPRNLVRSLSAPVSGTSFGKLLLEDRHVLTGAQIRRKHETIEKITINVKKQKKEKLSLREKVGRLFGRKMQTLEENHGGYNQDQGKDISSRPSSILSDYDQLENFTEVPPSPASVCSNAYDEAWRPAGCSSPAAMSDVTSIEDSMMPNAFREISSNLKELRRQLNELDTDGSEIAANDDQPPEAEMADIEDQSEAYIRDLLVKSGYYDGTHDKPSAKWEPSSKPIKDHVFEEMEDSHTQKKKDEDESFKDQNGKYNNHRIIFDLVNEALPSILGSPSPRSNLRRKFIDPGVRPLRGRALLDRVWESVSAHMKPQTNKSLESLIERDLQSSPWWSSYVGDDDDIAALGKDLECQIFGDLMSELVMEL